MEHTSLIILQMASILEMQTRNGEPIQLQKVDDYIFIKNSTASELRTKLKSIAGLEHREGDVLICSYPKCGTNWTSGMVRRVNVRGVAADQIDSFLGARIGLLELHPLERFESLISPRIIVTHLYPCRLPAYVKAGKAKILLILRNPKDVAVSYYYHLKLSQIINNKQDWDEFFNSFKSGIVPFGQYFDYLNAWELELQNNKNLDIEIFHFEDFKTDGRENVRRMAKHLGYTLDDNEVQALIDQCSIRNLEKADNDLKDKLPKGVLKKDGNTLIYRKGEIGDWKTHLTVAQNESYDCLLKDFLSKSMFNFRFE